MCLIGLTLLVVVCITLFSGVGVFVCFVVVIVNVFL